jgi:hypothetical protein
VVRTLLALTLLALLSCGQQVEPRVDAGRAGAEAPASASWDWEALGPGSWSGARTTADGLLVIFVGGAEYREGDPCSVAYRAEADESADEVRLRIGAWSPPAADGQPATCNAMGHTRQVEVTLGEPLGGRKLIEEQFDRQQPVFDGATLAEVGWVPEGWRAGPEIPGSPDGRYWRRSWSLLRPAPKNDNCTPTEAGLSLVEGPVDAVAGLSGTGGPGGKEFDLRGVPATYRRLDGEDGARLAWARDGRAFMVETRPGCVGDTLASEETMLRFARGLRQGATADG